MQILCIFFFVNLMGIRKMGEMGLKMAPSDSLPPRVKFSLQNMLIRGDFLEGNRPLGVCPIVDVRIRTALGRKVLK